MPVSSASTSCVLRAMAAENSVGSAIASSKEFVCRLCVPPSTAAIASTVVRTMLLYGSCSVSETPEVWQCVRSISEPGFFGSNCRMMRDQSSRAARSFATSMKKSMPIAKKKEMRPAKSSTSTPRASTLRTYSRPSASVKASSCTAVAPASCMWYPETEMKLNFGMCWVVYSMMSVTIRVLGSGG
jgi:hypothetical protein